MKPLCVDCDGTLIKTDLLHESLVRVLLRRPWRVAAVALWLAQGRNVLKMRLATEAEISYENLPFREEVLTYIRDRRSKGGKVYLATGAAEHHARMLADRLGVFDDIIASSEKLNLKGKTKEAILVERFGKGCYDYMGDSDADMKVWESADTAVIAARPSGFANKVRQVNLRTVILSSGTTGSLPFFRMLRLHQWAKNLILFVPLITAHKLFEPAVFFAALMAFFSFGLVASATYIVNDLFDLDHDRAHRTKRHRPLASGEIGIPAAVVAAAVCGLLGIGLASTLPTIFLATLGIYVTLTLSYSLKIKLIALADTITLATLYTLRLLAGHAATGIALSIWLIAFAIFLFFSLALAKRFVEVQDFKSLSSELVEIRGRGYCGKDLPFIGAMGVASGVISVLVVILYVSTEDVSILYTRPVLLLLLAPIFLYWIGRLWLFAYRSVLDEDPVLFALTDKVSYLCGLAAAAVIVAASLVS